MNFPLVSIVIPAFNAADYLPASIESALGQDYPNLEVLLINDGSTDNTRQVIEPYLDKISYFHQQNGGLASARNCGHQKAKGEYIAWLDADDIAAANRISIQIQVFNLNPSVVLVSSEFSAFSEQGGSYSTFSHQYYDMLERYGLTHIYNQRIEQSYDHQSYSVYSGTVLNEIVFGNFIHPPTVMIKTSTLVTAGDLDISLPTSEDWHYFTKLARCGQFAFVDIPLLNYRLSENQMSSISRNGERLVQNIVNTTIKIAQQNPDIISKDRVRYKNLLGLRQLNAADKFCDSDKLGAAKFLYQSVNNRITFLSQVKVALKILTPSFAMGLFRQLKKLMRRSQNTSL